MASPLRWRTASRSVSAQRPHRRRPTVPETSAELRRCTSLLPAHIHIRSPILNTSVWFRSWSRSRVVSRSHKPGGRLPLLSARPAFTIQSQNITALRPVPNYTACWQRHVGADNLARVVSFVMQPRSDRDRTCEVHTWHTYKHTLYCLRQFVYRTAHLFTRVFNITDKAMYASGSNFHGRQTLKTTSFWAPSPG